MKNCAKCGTTVNSSLPYCPNCGTLLPGEKEKSLILASEKLRLEKGATSGRSKGMAAYDKKQYEDAMNFYNSHLSTGYAPTGMVLVGFDEYINHLIVNDVELSQNKKKYGTQTIFRSSNPYIAEIPRYGVVQITKDRKVDVTFCKYWKKIYDKQDKWVRVLIQVVYWLLIVACAIGFSVWLYTEQFTWSSVLWILILIGGFSITSWIGSGIFKYE